MRRRTVDILVSTQARTAAVALLGWRPGSACSSSLAEPAEPSRCSRAKSERWHRLRVDRSRALIERARRHVADLRDVELLAADWLRSSSHSRSTPPDLVLGLSVIERWEARASTAAGTASQGGLASSSSTTIVDARHSPVAECLCPALLLARAGAPGSTIIAAARARTRRPSSLPSAHRLANVGGIDASAFREQVQRGAFTADGADRARRSSRSR